MRNKFGRLLMRQEGEGRGKVFITIIIIAVVVYTGAIVGPPFLEKMKLERELSDLLEVNRNKGMSFFENNVYNKLKTVKDDLNKDEVSIEDTGGGVTVTVHYVENLVFIKGQLEKP